MVVPNGHAFSPTFAVQPGNKYRVTITGGVAVDGSRCIYHRIAYATTYSPNIFDSGVVGYAGLTDFLGCGNMNNATTTYTYDWTCPAGVYFASIDLYQNGSATLVFSHVAVQDYSGVAQWGADVTGSNVSADTINVNGIAAATVIANVNAAYAAAIAANAELANIASDNVLSAGEKSAVILDYNTLSSEQPGLDSQAVATGITTAKTNYDAAILALSVYLGSLTTPTHWYDTSGDTTIVGSTFRAEFGTAYAARQALLDAIANVVNPIVGLMPAQAGADVTAINISAGIAGQGALATINQTNTGNIVPGAVNSSIVYSSTVEIIAAASATTVLAQLTLSTNGGYVKIRCMMEATGESFTNYAFPSLDIRKGDATGPSIMFYGNLFLPRFITDGGLACIAIEAVDATAAPSQQYTITMTCGSVAVACDGISLVVENAKV